MPREFTRAEVANIRHIPDGEFADWTHADVSFFTASEIDGKERFEEVRVLAVSKVPASASVAEMHDVLVSDALENLRACLRGAEGKPVAEIRREPEIPEDPSF